MQHDNIEISGCKIKWENEAKFKDWSFENVNEITVGTDPDGDLGIID